MDPTSGQHKSDRLQEPPLEEKLRPAAGADTRRWCRGKLGIEHDAVWQHWFECDWKGIDWQVKRCVNCGRQLGIRTVPSNRPSHQPPTL